MTEAFSDFVVGHGELWCARLLAASLAKSGVPVAFMDTRDVLVVTPTSDGNSVDVDYEASNARLDAWARKHGAPTVRLFWRTIFTLNPRTPVFAAAPAVGSSVEHAQLLCSLGVSRL